MSSGPQVVIGISAVDTSNGVLNVVSEKVSKTADSINESGDKTISKWSQVKENFKQNAQQILMGVAGLSASIVGFGTSFNSLEKTQLSADKANLTYQKSLEQLKDLQQSGKASSKDIALAQEQVRINLEKMTLAQDHAHDSFVNFLANVPAQFIGFASSAISILRTLGIIQEGTSVKAAVLSGMNFLLGKSQAEVTASTFVMSGAIAGMTAGQASSTASSLGLTGALSGMTAGTGAATLATRSLGLAMIWAFVSNPIGIALISITTLITLLIYNVGGVRDMFVNAGKAVLDFLDAHLKPLGDAIHWLVNLLNPLASGIIDAANGTKAYAESADQAGDSTVKTTQKLQTYEEYLQSVASETSKTASENMYYIQSHDELLSALVTSGDQINQVANYMRAQASEAASNAAKNFDLVASHSGLVAALSLTQDEVNDFADALRKQEQYQQDATDAADKERDAQQRATDQIRDRIQANADLAKSFGEQIDLTRTTVSETDRIADHLRDLQRDYENSRRHVEDFAIAHGVDVVKAVQASDDELLNIIGTMQGLGTKTSETRKTLVQDFSESRDAVKDYSTQTGVNTDLASNYFADYTAKAIADNEQLQKSIQKTIDHYEDLIKTARRAEAAKDSSNSSSSTGSSGLGGFAKGSPQNPFGFAEGGILDNTVYGFDKSGKSYLFGESGPEMFMPLSKLPSSQRQPKPSTRNLSPDIDLHMHYRINGREVARKLIQIRNGQQYHSVDVQLPLSELYGQQRY